MEKRWRRLVKRNVGRFDGPVEYSDTKMLGTEAGANELRAPSYLLA